MKKMVLILLGGALSSFFVWQNSIDLKHKHQQQLANIFDGQKTGEMQTRPAGRQIEPRSVFIPIPSILPTSAPLPSATTTPTFSPTPSPSISPLPTTTLTPSPVATFSAGDGVGGGGSQTVTLTPSPSPISSPTSTPNPTPSPIPEPNSDTSPRTVVINEIAWMGTASSSSDEWLELYNTSSGSVDLTGWTLKAKDGTPDILLASKSIGPFSFYLLERTSGQTISDIVSDQIYTGALGNGGEILELRDATGNLQDIVSKSNSGGWYAGNNSTKSSMERINPLASGSNAGNWATNNGLTKNGLDAGGHDINGTPGKVNSVYVAPSDKILLGTTNGIGTRLYVLAPSDATTGTPAVLADNSLRDLNWKIDLSGTTSTYPLIGPGSLYIILDGARLVKIVE